MRVLKIVLTAALAVFAVIAGLFVAAVAAGTGLVLAMVRRWRRGQTPGRSSALPHRAEARPVRQRDHDVIDVTATEVPSDPANR